MLANCFFKIITFCVISFLVCVLAVLVCYFCQSPSIAAALFNSYIFSFDGVLIVGFGYGLLWFIRRNGEQSFNSLFNILDIPESEQLSLLKYHEWVSSSKRKHIIAVIITVIGGLILWNCGYPLQGFAKYFLAVTSISLFYVAGLMSGYFISCLLIFRRLDEINSSVKIKSGSGPYELENINLSLLLCTTLGVVALYLAFRGTITANFVNTQEGFIFRKLLVYPIASFLPGILFTSFYCRYVLRKIQENEILQKIEYLQTLSSSEIDKSEGTKEKLEMEKLFMEIKEKLLAEKNKLPLLSLKDSPAIAISAIFIIELIIKNDDQIQNYFKTLFK